MADSITALFQDANADGAIGAASLNLLTPLDYNGQLQQAMGIDADDVTAAQVMLSLLQIDDSVSMTRMADEARRAQHIMLDVFAGSNQSDGVLLSTWTFEPTPIHPFLPLAGVDRLTDSTYTPWRSNTPLFDSVLRALGAVVAKTQEFSANGVPVRSVTTIVTDGGDNNSRHSASDVATVVRDLERAEMHVVLLIGIDDGFTDFQAVGRSMGIRDDRIKTVANSPSEFRRAIVLASQQSLQVSQTTGGGTVSQVGFGV